MRLLFSTLVLGLTLTSTSQAQFQRAQALELSCVHLYPVQMKYLVGVIVNLMNLLKRQRTCLLKCGRRIGGENNAVEDFYEQRDGHTQH